MDDTDIINCICGKEKDDGFMIQCEQCLEWQHGSCVHIKQNHVPTHYFCPNCKKGPKQYRKDKTIKPKKRKLKRAIYSSSEEEEEEEGRDEVNNDDLLEGGGGGGVGGGGDQRKKKFIEISKNITQDAEAERLLHRLRKNWLQIQKAKETGEKVDEGLIKGFESFVTMDDDSLTPSIPKASARPLQRSLRGASFSSQKDPSVQKGIFADIHIPEERYLLEIVGKIMVKSDYKKSEADFQKIEIPSRHVFFFRSLDLCVDARQYGNDGRFMRRSCRPNAEIKNILTPHSKKKQQQDGEFVHLGIYTRKEVDRGEELTLSWGWPRTHFMLKKKQEFMKNKDTTIEFDDKMRVYIKNMLPVLMLEYGDCACLDKDECFIEFLKEEIENKPSPKKTTLKAAHSSSSPPSSSSSTSHRNHTQHISKKPKTTSVNNSNKKELLSTSLSSATTTHAKKEFKKETTPITTTSHIIPPSPAGSVDDNDMGLKPIKMPVKKRWLQSYQQQQQQREQQKTTDSYPSDSSSENNIPLQTRKKLSLENYWNQRRN